MTGLHLSATARIIALLLSCVVAAAPTSAAGLKAPYKPREVHDRLKQKPHVFKPDLSRKVKAAEAVVNAWNEIPYIREDESLDDYIAHAGHLVEHTYDACSYYNSVRDDNDLSCDDLVEKFGN